VSGDEEVSKGPWAAGMYVRRARVAPVLLVVLPLLPLAATAITALPGWLKLASGGWFVATYTVQELGRDRGVRLQDNLWVSWGGAPTTDALRWRTSRNPILTADRHRHVQKLVGADLKLPDATAEESNPAGADHVYEAAVARLRETTRVGEPQLLAENASYGLRRNCLGLRPWGRAVAVLSLFVSLYLVLWNYSSAITVPAACTVGVSAISALFWWLVVQGDWVHRQAVAYSNCLFMVVTRRANNDASRETAGTGSTASNDEEA
jgi:hypothetical protein